MASYSCSGAGGLLPTAAIVSCPLQDCQVTLSGGTMARPFIPSAAVLARPLQHWRVASVSCCSTGCLIPAAATVLCPLQNCKVASCSCPGASVVSQLQPLCHAHCRTARWLPPAAYSTCHDSNGSHPGAAIAATSSRCCSMQLFRLVVTPHKHARSGQLAARQLAAPAGLPVQQLGGVCREVPVKTHLQALWHPATSRTSLVGSPEIFQVVLPWLPCVGTLDLNLLPLSSPYSAYETRAADGGSVTCQV